MVGTLVFVLFDVGLWLLICCYCCLILWVVGFVALVGWFALVYLALHALCCLAVVGSGLVVLIVWGLLPVCDLVLSDFCWLVCSSHAWKRLFSVLLDSFLRGLLGLIVVWFITEFVGRVCYLLWGGICVLLLI